jgi:transposase-like protein
MIKTKIPNYIKEKVMVKLLEPDCFVGGLSRSYGISRSTLYKWRSKSRRNIDSGRDVKLNQKKEREIEEDLVAKQASKNVSGSNFVELLPEAPSLVGSPEEPNIREADKFVRNSNLKKASLTFDKFSISIEGEVGSGKFISIIKILEEAC